jgi:hypothetical protein
MNYIFILYVFDITDVDIKKSTFFIKLNKNLTLTKLKTWTN